MLYRIIYLALIESSQCRGVAIISICCTVRYCIMVMATDFCFVLVFTCVCINAGATTTYDDIYTVYRNVSRSTREHKQSATSQCVNAHSAPFFLAAGRMSRSDLTSLFVFSCFVYINAPNRSNIPDIFILTGCAHPRRVIQRQYATSRDDVVDYEKLNLIRRACFRHT